ESTEGAAGGGDHPAAGPRLRPGAARVDDAHDLHAGAVRELRPHHHVAAVDAFEIVEVERDRLDPDPYLVRLGLGDRDGVELQHLERIAVPVNAPRSHRVHTSHLARDATSAARDTVAQRRAPGT